LGKIIPEYYKYVDELLGELLSLCDENTIIFVISDHGFGPDPQVVHNSKDLGLSGNHRNEAIFILSGKDVEPPINNHAAKEAPHQFDFLPTLLYVLNIPIAKDISGRPLEEYFTNDFRNSHQVKTIPTYMKIYRPSANRRTIEDDEKVIKDLKGLGYIK